MELRPFRALRGTPRFKERRPGMWIDRQVLQEEGRTLVVSVLVALVRMAEASAVEMPETPAPAEAVARRVGGMVSAKADAEPCLLVTRAPLEAALATTRRPDFTITDAAGVRHDFLRVNDYAQHVELQGLLKSAEGKLVSGRELWEAARQFSVSPAAAKLPGAKYKLCAIADERTTARAHASPDVPAGILGFSFEDPVY
ncbi:MAG TPA: hypothetical protein VER78_08440 [Thermoanaerobaculia bacterium]|nr:hypothetical protein [Thermoanaerobaculia bacterium]